MQPNFTLKNLRYLSIRIFALAMIFGLTSHVSFSQQKITLRGTSIKKNSFANMKEAKLLAQSRVQENVLSDNDAGLPNRSTQSILQRTEAVCATFTGDLAAGDLTMSQRLNRPGGAPSGNCAGGWVFPGTFGTGPYFYDVHTYTNTTGLTQCGTFTLSSTDLVNANIAFGLWNGSFNPASMATNNIAAPNTSSGSPATNVVLQVTIAAGQTIVLPVWSANVNTTAAGTASNYTITVDFPICVAPPCSGTPAPGQTNSTQSSVCSGIPFTLSLANNTSGSGVIYEWQSGPSATGPWTTIAGANSTLVIPTITATTFYRANVSCGANTGTSIPVGVNLTPSSNCYCDAGATSTSFEKISNVKFGTIDNSSTSTAGYENFTTISTNVIKGQVLPITVTSSSTYDGDKVFVWIDFNKNGTFTDPGELVYAAPANSAGPFIGNISIDPAAITGTTRMRIRMADQVFGTQNNTPCGNTTYGQVEDYTLNIQPCIPATFTNPAATTSVACGSNRTISIVTTGSIQAITWQTRPTATGTWQTITNGGIYSGATTATLTLTNVPQSLSGAQYRATVTGVCSAIDFSTPTTLTVTPLIATVTPTSQTICVGTIVPLTLTNAASTTTTTFNGSAGLPLAIPDDNITGVSNTINVSGIPAGSVIANASISIDLDHTWVGDIVLNLTAPNGQTINLIGALNNGTGGNGSDNFTNTVISSTGTTALSGAPAPRTGTFAADLFTATVPTIAPTTANAWAALLSGNINGAWKVSICDLAGPDDGILKSWSVILTYGVAATGSWTSTPTTPNTMFSDPAATIPYVANSQATTIYVKPTANTTYSVVYTNTTPCTSNPTNIAITVITPVTAVVSPVNTSVCVGGTATFTSSASGGPFSARQWQISTNSGVTWTSITGQTGSSLVLSNVMQTMNNYRYRVFYRTTPCVAAASDTSAAAILTVNPLPTVAISSSVVQLIPGRTTTINGTSTPAAAASGWSWTRDGVSIVGNSNTQVVGIAGVGTYQATVTDINGCVGKSNNLVIGSEASDRLWIYPNPTNGMFQVRLYYMSDVAQRRVVSIFNSQGQLVQEKSFSLLSNSQPYMAMDFDFTNKPAGIYLIKATEDITGKTVSGFIIIQ